MKVATIARLITSLYFSEIAPLFKIFESKHAPAPHMGPRCHNRATKTSVFLAGNGEFKHPLVVFQGITAHPILPSLMDDLNLCIKYSCVFSYTLQITCRSTCMPRIWNPPIFFFFFPSFHFCPPPSWRRRTLILVVQTCMCNCGISEDESVFHEVLPKLPQDVFPRFGPFMTFSPS